MIDLSVEIAGIKLKNPIMPASGCFGYGEEYMALEGFDIGKLGAVVTKGTKLLPTAGNDQPRMMEIPGGLINRIGLQNPGVAAVVRDKLPFLSRFKTPVIVNVCGSTVIEYVEVAKQLSESPVVSALEINISCPNVKRGMSFGQDPALVAEVISAVYRFTDRPLIPKLTPNVTSVIPIAKAVVNAGAEAISLTNTFLGRRRHWDGEYRGQYIEGGVSGPCIMAQSLRIVSDLAKANLGVPIIGEGGITTVYDVVEFLESGATAVEVGTANFSNPMVLIELINDLSVYIEKSGCQSIKEWREKGFPMPKE